MPASKEQQARTKARRMKARISWLSGMTWQQIADAHGYASRGAAQKDLARYLQQEAGDLNATAAELIDRELITLAELQTAFMPAARLGDEKAARVVLRIMDRRARYKGLDAAKTIKHVMTSEIDQRIEDLTNRMRRAAEQRPR
jgi:hypothetical protein